MSTLAANYLVTVINAQMRYVREHLETESSGRILASLQGHLQGFKDLFRYLSAELGLAEFALEDTGDIGTPVFAVDRIDDCNLKMFGLELDDLALEAFQIDIAALRGDPRWPKLLARVEDKTEEMKTYLIDYADKSRDLDLKQGERKGMTIYLRLFQAVEDEARWREDQRKEKAKNPLLFPDTRPAV